jgi:hypothetical protein
VIAPPTPLAPSSSTQVSNGTIAPSTLPHGMPTKVTPGSTPERQRDERAAPVVSVLQSSPERVRGADRSPSSRSQPVRTAANASPDAPSRDEDASSRRAGSNGSTHATNTQQSQPSAERSFDSL